MAINETENVVYHNKEKGPENIINWEMLVFCFIDIEILCYLVQCRVGMDVCVNTHCICCE